MGKREGATAMELNGTFALETTNLQFFSFLIAVLGNKLSLGFCLLLDVDPVF